MKKEGLEMAGTPHKSWSLKRLGEYTSQRRKMIAAEAWRIGKALIIAKKKCQDKKSSMTWTAWKRAYLWSDPTVSRYIRLCESYDHPGKLEGKSLVDALEAAWIPTKARSAKPKVLGRQSPKKTSPKKVPSPAFDLGLSSLSVEEVISIELESGFAHITEVFEKELHALVESGLAIGLNADLRHFYTAKAASIRSLLDRFCGLLQVQRMAA